MEKLKLKFNELSEKYQLKAKYDLAVTKFKEKPYLY
jgi:hypothetical protein